MINLKVGTQRTSVTYFDPNGVGSQLVFQKNSPGYGGAVARELLDKFGINEGDRGVWIIRTTRPEMAVRLFTIMDGLDLRRESDRHRLPLLVAELIATVTGVEKVVQSGTIFA